MDNIPDKRVNILGTVEVDVELRTGQYLMGPPPHDQGVDLACRYALLPGEAGPTSQKVSTSKPQLFITINALWRGLAARGRLCIARTHLFTLIYNHKGALRPLPQTIAVPLFITLSVYYDET
jgi:hypothetical protein